ncbi:MAG: hypothetical protein KF822_11295 [Steroidobacteraceae bacterium]|nr:hypothetical protein [Steroidobacteraceae bacterium]
MSRSSDTMVPLFAVSQVDVVVHLPDGSTRSTILSAQETRDLVGVESEYSMFWWMRGAARKLAIHELLTSLVSSSSFQFGSSCKVRQEPGAIPRFEITYGRPNATSVAAV